MTSFKDKIDKHKYTALVAECKKNAAIGKALRLAAEDNKGIVRYMLRDSKRSQAPVSRRYLWILAFFRGRTLDEIEPKRNPDNELSMESVADSISYYSKPGYAKIWDREKRKTVLTTQFIKDINHFFGKQIWEVPAEESKSQDSIAEAV